MDTDRCRCSLFHWPVPCRIVHAQWTNFDNRSEQVLVLTSINPFNSTYYIYINTLIKGYR